MMPKRKPYYPNNWKAIKDAPDQFFLSLPFDQFMDWKMCGWEIPSSVGAMIRETNLKTGKVKEYVYKKHGAAKDRARKIMNEGNAFIVCTAEAVHHMYPEEIPEYDDPLA